MKKLLIILFLFCLVAEGNCQGYFEGGYATKEIGVMVAGGYLFTSGALKDLDINAGADANIFSVSVIPNVFHVNIGHKMSIGNFVITPSAGVAHVSVDLIKKDGVPEMNYTRPYYSLQIGKDATATIYDGSQVSIRYFGFVSYSYNLYGGAGVRFFIKTNGNQ